MANFMMAIRNDVNLYDLITSIRFAYGWVDVGRLQDFKQNELTKPIDFNMFDPGETWQVNPAEIV
jgi:hypothetical protein